MLEIILGIDNLSFITILIGQLSPAQRRRAHLAGLALAMLTRIALLFGVVFLTHLVAPWLRLGGRAFSGRDLVLLGGGLFLLIKSVLEIHAMLERAAGPPAVGRVRGNLAALVVQIALVDIVFSLDSVFTAVGLVQELPVMVAAIAVAILVMMWVSGSVAAFIERHPTVKMLALAFLLLIGAALLAQGLHFEIPKGYLYFAMAFALAVELINARLRNRRG
ncbi:MAG: TerC family protein [Steroidobacteraceae bacterium]